MRFETVSRLAPVVRGVLTLVLTGAAWLSSGCTPPSLYKEFEAEASIPKTVLMDRNQIDAIVSELRELQSTVVKDEKNPELFYRIGLLEERLGRWDRALRAFQDVINRNSKHAEAYYHAGFVAEKMGESYDIRGEQGDKSRKVEGYMRRYALDSYKKAVKHKPNFADAHYRLCLTLLLENDINGATRAYQQLAGLEPDTERTKETLMKIYNQHQAKKN